MNASPISERMANSMRTMEPFLRYFNDPTRAELARDPDVCDFAVGNPHEMPLPGFVDALRRWAVPGDKDWFAYKMNEMPARQAITESLHRWRGVFFEPEDIFLTNGAFGALTVAINTVVGRGDEVIFVSPPWFFYEAMITMAEASPVRVPIDPESFDLDLGAIEKAVTSRTRAIIINSPHNPTGKIYPPQTLAGLAQILSTAAQRAGHRIHLISDESYSRIIFDGHDFPSPTSFYPDSFLIYTYGKTLLTPGQRLGYIALPGAMRDREQLRAGIMASQLLSGYSFPNALLQHALPDLEGLSIDVAHLEEKRDRMVEALRAAGYQVRSPEGTFYLMVASPWPDDWSFVQLLAGHKILALPGTIVEMPGYFRLSLTANDDMIQRAIPRFEQAMDRAARAANAA